MATDHIMTQAITWAAIEAVKAAIIAVREVDNPVNNARQLHTMSRSGNPTLRQPTVDLNQLKNIRNCEKLRQRQRSF